MEGKDIVPRKKSELLRAELAETEKDIERNQRKLNDKKLKLKRQLLKEEAEEDAVRHLAFMQGKSPFWIGTEGNMYHRYMRAVIRKPFLEGENEHVRARVTFIQISVEDDLAEASLMGETSSSFSMSITTDRVASMMGKDYRNCSEQEFMDILNKRAKPFFDMIRNATKDVFTGNLLGPAVTEE